MRLSCVIVILKLAFFLMFYVFLCNNLSNGYTKSIIVTDMNPMWLTGVKAPTKLTNLAFTGTRQSWEAIFFCNFLITGRL